MKVLIAGGAGYVGSILIPKLLANKHQVDVVDLMWFGNHLPEGVNISNTAVMDLKVEDVQGYDCIVFLAGLSNDPMANFSPAMNFVENAAAPAYLAYIAREAGVSKFVHAGSCSVYGYTVTGICDEQGPTMATYPYGISKLQGESGCMSLQCDDFSVISLRMGTVCGMSPRMRFDLIINAMFKNAMSEGYIQVNNPDIWRPILAIEDAAQAYVRAIEAPREIHGIFNISSGNYTVGEVAKQTQDAIHELSGNKIDIHEYRKPDIRNYRVSHDKCSDMLGYTPTGSVGSIVRDIYDACSNGFNFQDSRYYNIQIFTDLLNQQTAQQITV